MGDGLFDQTDIVAALVGGHYGAGPYGATGVYDATVGSRQGALNLDTASRAALDRWLVSRDAWLGGALSDGQDLGEIDLDYVPVPAPSAIVLGLVGVWVGIGRVLRDRAPRQATV